MRTNSTTKKVLSLVLAVCFMISMLPMMLVSATGTVEITSPSHGGFLAYGKEVVIRVEAPDMPNIFIGDEQIGVGMPTDVDGVYDCAWTPTAYGEATITAEAGGVIDTIKVFVGNTQVLTNWEMDGETWADSENHWAPKYATANGVADIASGGFTFSEKANAVVTEGAYIYDMALTIPENAEGTYHEFRHRTSSSSTQRIANFKDGTINLAHFQDNNRWDDFYTPGVPFVLTVVFDYTDKTLDFYKDGVLKYSDVHTSSNAATFAAIRGFQWYANTSLIVDRITVSKEIAIPAPPVASLDIVSPADGETFLPGDNVVVKVQATNLPAGESVIVTTNGGITATATQVGTSDIYTATLANVTANDTQILAKAGNVVSKVCSLNMMAYYTESGITGKAFYDFNGMSAGDAMTNDFIASWSTALPGVTVIDEAHGNSMLATTSWAKDNVLASDTIYKASKLIFEAEYNIASGSQLVISLMDNGGNGASNGDISLAPNKVDSQRNGAWGAKTIVAPAGSWNKVRMIADLANKTKTIYVNDDLIFEDIAFNSKMIASTGRLQRIGFYRSGNTVVDNMSVKLAKPATGAATSSLTVASTEELGRTIPVAMSGAAGNISLYADGVLVGTGAKVNWTPDAVGEVELMAVAADGKFAIKTVEVLAGNGQIDMNFEGVNAGDSIPNSYSTYPTMSQQDAAHGNSAVMTQTGKNVNGWCLNPSGAASGKTTGVIFMEADFYRSAGTNFNIAMRVNSDVGGDWLFMISDANIGYTTTEGGARAWKTATPSPTADAWHKMRVVYNLTDWVHSIFIDDTPIFIDIPISLTMKNQGSVTRQYWYCEYIDNVRVSYDVAYEAPAVVDGVANTKLLSGRSELDTVVGLNYHDTVAFSTDVTAAAAGDVWVTFIAYKNVGDGAVQITGKNLQKVTMAAGETKTVTGNFRLGSNLETGDYVKVFVWNNAMAPFCDAYVMD